MADRTRIGLDNPQFSGRLKASFSGRPSPDARYSQTRYVPPIPRQSSVPQPPKPISKPNPAAAYYSHPNPVAPEIPRVNATANQRTSNELAHRVQVRTEPTYSPQSSSAAQMPPADRATNYAQPASYQPPKPPHPYPVALDENKFQKARPATRRKTPRLFNKWSLAAAAFLILVGAGSFFLYKHEEYLTSKKLGPNLAAAAVTSAPISNPPSQAPSSASQPEFVDVSSLSAVQNNVYAIGPNANNYIAAPTSNFGIAWYKNSSVPGQTGMMLLETHADYSGGSGILANAASNVKTGDVINVINKSGQSFNYDVVRVEVVPSSTVNLKQLLAPIAPNQPGLNLVSTPGDTIPGSTLNQPIIIISATLQ